MRIRERPSLRLDIGLETPTGRHYHFSDQESRPENAPSGLRFSSVIPGGFDSLDATLPRKPGTDYADLEPFSTLTARLPGGDVVSEVRLERTPRTSGSQFSVSLGTAGWQAHLEDNQFARLLGVDRDLGKWGGASIDRKLILNANFAVTDGSSGDNAGVPTIRTGVTGPWTTSPGRPLATSWYDAQGLSIGALYYAWSMNTPALVTTDANWNWAAFLSDDSSGTHTDSSGNLRAAGPGLGAVSATGTRKFAALQLSYANVAAGGPADYAVDWTPVVVGDHGITLLAGAALYASDIIEYVIGAFCPLFSTDIDPSSFPIEQFAQLDATTAADLITQANRFHLYDWAVWEDKTFSYYPRGSRGKTWRARVAPSQLSETGPQVDRIWESVIVSYQDVDGTTKTAGPPGSGADTEDAALKDSDPENPANELGITRRSLLQAGTLTPAGAVQVGSIFLSEQRLLDTSGQATLVGHVEDDHGVLHAVSKVRAGDGIVFTDAADSTSTRRIVKTDYDHDSRTVTIDLDSPPEALDSLLQRLSVVLVPLGLT